MPTPVKPIDLVKGHRTKAEIEARKQAEKELKSKNELLVRPEVKKDKVAHKEFQRIKSLLGLIDKDDELYSSVINRYCLLQSECLQLQKLRNVYSNDLEELSQDKDELVEGYGDEEDEDKISLSSYYKMKNNFQKNIISLDLQLQSKRKMLLDIEKENLMTILSALRSTTKPAKEEKPPENPFLSYKSG